jgi:hypothetical protein
MLSLVETSNETWAMEQLGLIEPALPLVFRAHRGWPDNEHKVMNLLVDDLERPQVVVLHHGAYCFLLGTQAALPAALADLYHGRIEQSSGWPDATTREHWDEAGHRFLGIQLPGLAPYVAARNLGFHIPQVYHEGTGAYFYYTFGEPRFASEIKHPCRVVEGLELFSLMRTGVSYDPAGVYIKRCLEQGPSFVCEVDGEPVAWSCTHLNRCLGMIFTPPPHRRHGYARSLAALQLDTMLKLDGRAYCHVLAWNLASQGMMNSLGVSRIAEPLVWRTLTWRAPRRLNQGWVRGVLAG